MISAGPLYSSSSVLSSKENSFKVGKLDYMTDALEQFKKETSVTMKVSYGSIGPIIIGTMGRNDHALMLPVDLTKAAKAA